MSIFKTPASGTNVEAGAEGAVVVVVATIAGFLLRSGTVSHSSLPAFVITACSEVSELATFSRVSALLFRFAATPCPEVRARLPEPGDLDALWGGWVCCCAAPLPLLLCFSVPFFSFLLSLPSKAAEGMLWRSTFVDGAFFTAADNDGPKDDGVRPTGPSPPSIPCGSKSIEE